MPKIHFIDVTNRDAVQASRINLSKLQKTMVNFYLGQMGIHQSEFAFPFARNEQNYAKPTFSSKRWELSATSFWKAGAALLSRMSLNLSPSG